MLGGMTAARLALGRAAEEQAARWYRSRGYVVLARNWRCRDGELDLALQRRRDRVVVVCEVKARRSAAYGTAAEAVGPRKQAQVRRVARRFLAEHDLRPGGVRFDVAAWDAGRLTVLEAAF